jgi:replicative DNA helicase
LDAEILVQQGLEAEAKKQVTRLKEAKENSEQLSAIADAIASAKEQIDVLVDDFKVARDELADAIQARLDSFPEKEQEIDTLSFELN